MAVWAGGIAQNSSVQLPGGVKFSDRGNERPFIVGADTDLGNIIKQNIFVKATVSKANSFEGEPVLVTYKLYTRLRSESKVVKQPEFSGCSIIEMTTDDLFTTTENVNGKTFKTYVIRKVQVLPLQDGTVTLGTAAVENKLFFFRTNEEAYKNSPGITKNVVLSSQPVVLHIKPLPGKKPVSFNGAVGNFTITTVVNKRNDTANDNNSLQVIIEGKGNFQNLGCPLINWPKEIEHFEAETDESIERLSFPQSGKKVFTIPFTCKKEGQVTVPPVLFSYFNTDTNLYTTIKSDSITLTVLPEVKQLDAAKLSGDITNKKYIFIVPAIALLAGLGWWFFFGRNEKKVTATPTAAVIVEEMQEPVIVKTDAEKLNELLLIEDDKTYYQQAKIVAEELLEKERDSNKKNSLQLLIQQCNEALYAQHNLLTKEEVLRGLESAVLNQSTYL